MTRHCLAQPVPVSAWLPRTPGPWLATVRAMKKVGLPREYAARFGYSGTETGQQGTLMVDSDIYQRPYA
jgi:hypothetical protein